MVHTVAIVVHATAAVLAFVAGATALIRPALIGWLPPLLVVSLAGLVVAVVGQAHDLGVTGWTVDLALIALLVAVVVRAERARRVVPSARHRSERFLGGTGFGLVSLADGFVVVGLLDLGAPVWVVVGSGLAVAVVGHVAITRLCRRRAGGRAVVAVPA